MIALASDHVGVELKRAIMGHLGALGLPYDVFRHSRAVHWLEAGLDLQHIKHLLCHADLKTTEVYARIMGTVKGLRHSPTHLRTCIHSGGYRRDEGFFRQGAGNFCHKPGGLQENYPPDGGKIAAHAVFIRCEYRFSHSLQKKHGVTHIILHFLMADLPGLGEPGHVFSRLRIGEGAEILAAIAHHEKRPGDNRIAKPAVIRHMRSRRGRSTRIYKIRSHKFAY